MSKFSEKELREVIKLSSSRWNTYSEPDLYLPAPPSKTVRSHKHKDLARVNYGDSRTIRDLVDLCNQHNLQIDKVYIEVDQEEDYDSTVSFVNIREDLSEECVNANYEKQLKKHTAAILEGEKIKEAYALWKEERLPVEKANRIKLLEKELKHLKGR